MLNVWLIQIGEPIPIKKGIRKQRLSLLCEEVINKGHHVIRWGSAFDHITKKMIFETDTEIRIAQNYTIKFVKGLGYSKNISVRRWIDHFLIEEKILRMAQKSPKPDIILVATPPHSIAYKVVRYAKQRNIPVIIDIRDQWPEIFIERLPEKLKKVGKYILFYEFYKLKKALFNADSVTAMMDELLQWGLKLSGKRNTSHNKVFYIGTRIADEVNINDVNADLMSLFSDLSGKTVFTFVGTFGNFYNPAIIVDVAKILEKEGRKDVIFILAGSGEHYDDVKKKAGDLGNISLTGWLQHEEIMALLKVSDVGICSLNEHRPCFPNKIFIYLSAQLPVISSTPGEFQRLMEKYQIGIYYEPCDVKGLYDAVTMLTNPLLLAELKRNVKNIFGELFDADKIYKEFAQHIEYVVANN